MSLILHPSQLSGKIDVPSSKSHTLRAILLATLATGITTIHGYLASGDTERMIDACRILGAKIKLTDSTLTIVGTNGKIQPSDVIYAGNSGLVLRLCSAIGALCSFPVVITGDHSLRYNRPMRSLLDGLKQLGCQVQSMRGDDYAPVLIQGPICPGETSLCGEDSQPVSALLLAAAFAKGPIKIHVINPGERPWIDLTLSWLTRLGVHYKQEGYTRFELEGNSTIQSFDYTVPGDLSSAAFPIAAALVTGSELTLHHVDLEDIQGDKKLIPVLEKMGATIQRHPKEKTVHVCRSTLISNLEIDINDFIDAVPILATLACYAAGKTTIRNAAIARHKECNRLACITKELKKMGGIIEETEDGVIVYGNQLRGASVDSHHDHRIAMSLAIAALGAEGKTILSDPGCVEKTFPHFFTSLQAVGAIINELP